MKWISVKERLPSGPPDYEQVDVIFTSPYWAVAMVGMFTCYIDGTYDWSLYDQLNDKYVKWNSEEPQFWMPFPKFIKE